MALHGTQFYYQHLLGSSQLLAPQASGALMLSSGFLGDCMYVVHRQRWRQNTHTITTPANNNNRNIAISTETQTKALTNISGIIKSDSI